MRATQVSINIKISQSPGLLHTSFSIFLSKTNHLKYFYHILPPLIMLLNQFLTLNFHCPAKSSQKILQLFLNGDIADYFFIIFLHFPNVLYIYIQFLNTHCNKQLSRI